MGGQALFSDFSGNPEDARIRLAPQDKTTVSGSLVYPDPPGEDSEYQQGHFDGQGLMLSQSEIEDLVLGTSGVPQDGLSGKRNIEGGPLRIGTVDPGNPIMYCALAGVFGSYESTDNTTWQRQRFFIDATADDGGGDVVESFMLQENGQVFTPIRATGVQFTGYSWSAAPNGPFQIEFPFVADRYDLFGDITQTAGSGSTKIKAIGSFPGNLVAEATDNDIHVKFTAASSPYSIQAKIGAAASYSNTQTGWTEGTWLYLEDESGDPIGDFRDQVRIFIPASATITLNDEFKIPRRHIGWSDSLGTRRPISSVNIRAYIDADPFGSGDLFEIPVTGLSGSVEWDGVQVNPHIPTAQGKDISKGGSLVGTVNLTRRIRDLLFQKGIVNGDEVAFILDAQSDTEIGSTGKYYRFLEVRPRCKVSGSTFQTPPGGGGERNESPVLMAKEPASNYTYDGVAFSSHVSVLLQNSISDISSLVAA